MKYLFYCLLFSNALLAQPWKVIKVTGEIKDEKGVILQNGQLLTSGTLLQSGVVKGAIIALYENALYTFNLPPLSSRTLAASDSNKLNFPGNNKNSSIYPVNDLGTYFGNSRFVLPYATFKLPYQQKSSTQDSKLMYILRSHYKQNSSTQIISTVLRKSKQKIFFNSARLLSSLEKRKVSIDSILSSDILSYRIEDREIKVLASVQLIWMNASMQAEIERINQGLGSDPSSERMKWELCQTYIHHEYGLFDPIQLKKWFKKR